MRVESPGLEVCPSATCKQRDLSIISKTPAQRNLHSKHKTNSITQKVNVVHLRTFYVPCDNLQQTHVARSV